MDVWYQCEILTHAETGKSINLFAREVLPRLRVIAPVQAGFNQQ